MGFSYLRDRQQDGTLSETWLIQRLDKPRESGEGIFGADNPFAFGGGYKNGGLSDDAMAIIRGIWSFDYMGAAEFEFGAVPDALQKIAQSAQKGRLTTHVFEFDKSGMEKDWRKDWPVPDGTATLYVICEKGDEEEIQSRIETWANERYNRGLKETTRLSDVLNPNTSEKKSWQPRTAGWLEINNGFMFFVDKTMFEQTAHLFGLSV